MTTSADRPAISAAEAKAQLELLEDLQKAALAATAELKGRIGVDQRWLHIGITDLEKSFMSINRAIYEPQAVALLQAAFLEAVER